MMKMNMFLLYFLVRVLFLSRAYSLDPPTILDGLKLKLALTKKETSVQSTEKGYVACACGGLIPDLLRTLYFLRFEWNSRLPISIMHCEELSNGDIDLIKAMDAYGNVNVVDICATNEKLNKLGVTSVARLRGFFCKVAALILSPYENTLLMDLDLVWFRSPDELFESRLYQQTGALFFRDRILYTSAPTEPSGASHKRMKNFVRLFQDLKIDLNSTYVQSQYYANGVSPWWRCLQAFWPKELFKEKCYGETQDSSMVLVNKSRHPGMLATLLKLLPTFDVGYGDKEIYWMAATIANEPFTFSPFAAGQYGDCSGQVLHYFPDDIFLLNKYPKNKIFSIDTATAINAELQGLRPFYMNAEYTVEKSKKLNAVGNYFQHQFVSAQLFHDPRTMENITTGMIPHNMCYSKPHFANNCTCETYHCQPILPWMLHQLAYNQWVTLSMSLERGLPLSQYYKQNAMPFCVPILLSAIPALNSVFHHHAAISQFVKYVGKHAMSVYLSRDDVHHKSRFDSSNHTLATKSHHSLRDRFKSPITTGFDRTNCGVIGCPFLPLYIFNESLRDDEMAWSPGFGRFCEPVSFEIPSVNDTWNYFHANFFDSHFIRSPSMDSNISKGIRHISSLFAHKAIEAYDGQSLAVLAEKFRIPREKINAPLMRSKQQLIMCPGSRTVYQLSKEDGVFHMLPNWETFVKMGLDAGNVMALRREECEMVKFGAELPSL